MLILKSRSFFVQVLCIVLSILTSVIVTLTSTRGYHCQPEVAAPREYYIGAGALIFVFVSEAVLHYIYSGISAISTESSERDSIDSRRNTNM